MEAAAPQVRITYYLEVLSSWCLYAEPAWAALQARFGNVASFDWKIALMDAEAFPSSVEQCEWFYRRSGTLQRSPRKMNSGWFEPEQGRFLPASLMALGAKSLGVTDDSVRRALANAGLYEGKKIGRWEVAAAVASEATGIFPQELLARAQSPEILAEAERSTAEFSALQVSQRPAFLLESRIGDRAVFSGLVQVEPLIATMEAMLRDIAGYESFAAHFGAFSAH